MNKIIVVDFDGTICLSKDVTDIEGGLPNIPLINVLNKLLFN